MTTSPIAGGRRCGIAQESDENRRLFETSLDLILVTDARGNFVRVSPISISILGYAPEEMVGRSGAEFVYPDDLETHAERDAAGAPRPEHAQL